MVFLGGVTQAGARSSLGLGYCLLPLRGCGVRRLASVAAAADGTKGTKGTDGRWQMALRPCQACSVGSGVREKSVAQPINGNPLRIVASAPERALPELPKPVVHSVARARGTRCPRSARHISLTDGTNDQEPADAMLLGLVDAGLGFRKLADAGGRTWGRSASASGSDLGHEGRAAGQRS